MDELQSKINVIGWLTDYKGTIIAESKRIIVELNNKKRLNKWFLTAKSTADMLTKLDGFINTKVRVQ
jgi:hypothetical protein